jgi:hypothetical protein
MVCLVLVSKNEFVGFEFLTAMRMLITALLIGNLLQMFWGSKLLCNMGNKLQINTTSYNKSVLSLNLTQLYSVSGDLIQMSKSELFYIFNE